MVAMQAGWLRMGLFAVGLGLLLTGSVARGQEKDEALRAELLKLNGASSEDVQNAKLRALIKDRAKAKKAVQEAARMMKEAKDDNKPFNLNASLILAKAAHVVKLYDIAETFYNHELQLAIKANNGSKIRDGYEGLIDLQWEAKRYDDVVDTCERVLEAKGPKEVVQFQIYAYRQLVQAKAKQGKTDEALNMVKGLAEVEPDLAWFFLEAKGWVQREEGKLGDAIATYNTVLDKLDSSKMFKPEKDATDKDKEELTKDKERQKDRVRYILSGLYVDNKDLDNAAKQLEALIKRHPDSATYKNDLGFIWCDNDIKLPESEKLIREALALDKKEKEKLKKDGKIEDVIENAAYLDSLGWVLYKEKKYKEALEPLKKASADEDEGNHLEIWDHLADCYAALGQKKDAISAWEKALKMEDVSPRDGERRRKVSDKLKKMRLEISK